MTSTPHPDAGPAAGRPPGRTPRAGRDLPAAIITGVVLIGIVVGTVLWWHWGFVIFVALAMCAGTVELHRAMALIDMHSAQVPILVGAVVMVLGAFAAAAHDLPVDASTYLLACLGLTSAVCMLWRLPGGSKGFIGDVAASLLTISYLPLLGSFIPLMMADDQGTERIVSFLLCVIASDTGGYVVGVIFGKHPMAPRISPKKSWEGMAGSVGGAMLVGAGCAAWILSAPVWVGIVLGGVLSVAATCGDLVESMIKRDVGLKDMSNFLPGHGGVMDRLDSMLLSAPFAWVVMSLCL